MKPENPEVVEAVPAVLEEPTPGGELACVGLAAGLPPVALPELAIFAPLVISAVFGAPADPCDRDEATLGDNEVVTEGLPRTD